jgi:hypothetical protein
VAATAIRCELTDITKLATNEYIKDVIVQYEMKVMAVFCTMQLTVLDAHCRSRCQNGQGTGIQLQNELHVTLHLLTQIALYNRSR